MARANLDGLATQLEREAQAVTLTRLLLIEALAAGSSAEALRLQGVSNAALVVLARANGATTGRLAWEETEAAEVLGGLGGGLEGRFKRAYEAGRFDGTLGGLVAESQGQGGMWLSGAARLAVWERCEAAMEAEGA